MKLFSGVPTDVRERILSRARSARLAFPESSDERVLAAARLLTAEAGVQCIFVDGACSIALEKDTLAVMESCAAMRGKLLSQELQRCASDPFFTAGSMLVRNEADAVVGGAVATTAHVIRAALNTVGMASHASLLTSCFLFQLRSPTPGGEDVVLYADPGVIPQPTEAQLVQIAALASRAFELWTGREPRIGFLSFSTHGSAEHPDVSKMRRAAAVFAQEHPDVISEGEVQFDAAVVPDVALRKNPSSQLRGRANVFVFPDLDAANISYKITQRLAGAEAWGPVLLGTFKPYSDLSRGASALDIAHVALLSLALGRTA